MLETEFHFDSGRAPKSLQRQNGPRRTEMALEALATVTESVEFECDALFVYSGEAARSLFPIRFGLPELPDRPIDEIRGITGVKLVAGEEAYRVSLESLDLRGLQLEVDFVFSSQFFMDLPQLAMKKASDIASHFVEA